MRPTFLPITKKASAEPKWVVFQRTQRMLRNIMPAINSPPSKQIVKSAGSRLYLGTGFGWKLHLKVKSNFPCLHLPVTNLLTHLLLIPHETTTFSYFAEYSRAIALLISTSSSRAADISIHNGTRLQCNCYPHIKITGGKIRTKDRAFCSV